MCENSLEISHKLAPQITPHCTATKRAPGGPGNRAAPGQQPWEVAPGVMGASGCWAGSPHGNCSPLTLEPDRQQPPTDINASYLHER